MSDLEADDQPSRAQAARDVPPPIGSPVAPPVSSIGSDRPVEQPKAVRTAGIWLIVLGALAIVFALLFLANSDGAGATLLYLQLPLSGVQIIAGIFLLQGKEWARITATVVCGLSVLGFLIGGIVGIARGGSVSFIGLALYGMLLARLNKPEVREWCNYWSSGV